MLELLSLGPAFLFVSASPFSFQFFLVIFCVSFPAVQLGKWPKALFNKWILGNGVFHICIGKL